MERRELRFTDLSEAVAEVRRLKKQGYTKAGDWELGEICEHLTKTMSMMIYGANFNLPFFVKWMIRMMYMKKVLRCEPLKMKASAPKGLLPSETVDVEKAVAEFERVVNQIVSPEVSLISNHPVFGKISREECVKVQAWHAAHHLSFLIPKNS